VKAEGRSLEAQAPELDSVARSLAELGESLASSYRALERRAERVEAELSRANTELEHKIADLDELSRDLEAILEALPTGVLVRDGAGRIRRANRAALAILGLDARALVGETAHPLLDTIRERRASGEVQCADGRARVVATLASPIQPHAKASEAGSVEILDDRTELYELNGRLHAQEKLAALGNMAGGIAHELRNPMNAVKGFAALLVGRLAPDTKERHFAGRIVEGVSEADAILASMLTLARAEPLVRETVDGRELVASAIQAAIEGRPESERARWRISASFVPDPPPEFVADRVKLRQALRNLIANAVEAQPEGGTVGVSLERAGSDLVLRVADSGPGIAPQLRRRILEPFFTTRAEGTGLGLALVNTIAQLHSGRVEVATDPSLLGGADISIHIPIHSPR
jgi:two-component system sensor histidine kinase FlrB